jgi:bifunctional non-homologous end joining protein LigD
MASQLIKRPQPSWIDPMLATLTEERFSHKDWIFEKKLDGVRALAFRKGNEIQILSRNKLSFNRSYPEIVENLQKQNCNRFIVDGEIAALDAGISSFARLQQRGVRRTRVYYFIFDLLYFDGNDTRQLPLLERKRLLRKVLTFNQTIRYVSHKATHGEAYYEHACKQKWEGVIAKRLMSPYVSRRSKDWLKFKCSMEQEFVIVGYTDPEGQRTGFGALLIGFYSEGQLMYAGKVGTGFTAQTLNSLTKQFVKLHRATAPAKGIGLPKKNVHWLDPVMVAQIGFSEWTDDNKLRHPRFLGIRTDKAPEEVIREQSESL